ncbi:MAG TPA: DUF433 domain-containing protein [Leptospiraceae bacterium]|nr:DUF433 domain-containing protein [Leptospiraceae bacterium]
MSADNENILLNRIVTDPKILSGKPVIRGTRLSVQFVLGLLSSGSSFQEILDEYPDLAKEDIQACFHFAIHSLESSSYLPLSA